MRRDFSSFHTSTIPAAFLRRPKDEIHPPHKIKIMARNFLRNIGKIRKKRFILYMIFLAIVVYGVLRVSNKWKQQRHSSTGSISITEVTEKPSGTINKNPTPSKIKTTKTTTTTTTAPKAEIKSHVKHSEDIENEEIDDINDGGNPPGDSPHENTIANVLIIGAQYCGTRPLAAFLSQHSDIAVSDTDSQYYSDNYEKGKGWYASTFSGADRGKVYLVERSPSYLYSTQAAERAKKADPDMKIIAILRNPLKRLISNFTSSIVPKLKSETEKDAVFEKLVIDPVSHLTNVENIGVKRSIYALFLKRWLDTFTKEQVFIVDGDSFIKNPLPILKNIEDFLDLNHELTEDHTQFNSTSGYFCLKSGATPTCFGHVDSWHHQSQSDYNVLQRIRNFYHHHNDKLFDLIGERFEWS